LPAWVRASAAPPTSPNPRTDRQQHDRDDLDTSRKLIFDTNHPEIQLVLIRSADVPTYVQYGAADMGIAGKDVLLEHGGEGLYEWLDLKIAPARWNWRRSSACPT